MPISALTPNKAINTQALINAIELGDRIKSEIEGQHPKIPEPSISEALSTIAGVVTTISSTIGVVPTIALSAGIAGAVGLGYIVSEFKQLQEKQEKTQKKCEDLIEENKEDKNLILSTLKQVQADNQLFKSLLIAQSSENQQLKQLLASQFIFPLAHANSEGSSQTFIDYQSTLQEIESDSSESSYTSIHSSEIEELSSDQEDFSSEFSAAANETSDSSENSTLL